MTITFVLHITLSVPPVTSLQFTKDIKHSAPSFLPSSSSFLAKKTSLPPITNRQREQTPLAIVCTMYRHPAPMHHRTRLGSRPTLGSCPVHHNPSRHPHGSSRFGQPGFDDDLIEDLDSDYDPFGDAFDNVDESLDFDDDLADDFLSGNPHYGRHGPSHGPGRPYQVGRGPHADSHARLAEASRRGEERRRQQQNRGFAGHATSNPRRQGPSHMRPPGAREGGRGGREGQGRPSGRHGPSQRHGPGVFPSEREYAAAREEMIRDQLRADEEWAIENEDHALYGHDPRLHGGMSYAQVHGPPTRGEGRPGRRGFRPPGIYDSDDSW
ncbi:MAG: hypothetical protein Q9181_007250 [Wetmoreana brouardii]